MSRDRRVSHARALRNVDMSAVRGIRPAALPTGRGPAGPSAKARQRAERRAAA